MELLNGQCKNDFEKWYTSITHQGRIEWKFDIDEIESFYDLPLSMQVGVYEDFLSNRWLELTINYRPQLDQYSYDIIETGEVENSSHKGYNVAYNSNCESIYYNTRQEARTEAIKHANNIYNERFDNS